MTNKDIAKAWFESIDKQDFKTVRSLMHKDHTFHNPMTPTPAGPEDHVGMMTMMTGAFSGAHQLDLVLSEGNHVVVRGTWRGKHSGEFNGIAATGKSINFTFIDIFEVVDGKVKKEAFEMNPASIMAQINAN